MAKIKMFVENNVTHKRSYEGVRHEGTADEMKKLWRSYRNSGFDGVRGSSFGTPYMYYCNGSYVYELTLEL